jgi:hypothetical protein
MKIINYIIIVMTASLSFVGFVCAQERDLQMEANLVLIEKINKAASLSKAAGELQIKMNSGFKNAALDAIKSGDLTLIPLLELYADNGIQRMTYNKLALRTELGIIEYHKQQNGDADVALAKLGRTEYLTRIINQTDKSKSLSVRYEAVRKLSLIGNKVAYRKILELLDETTVPLSNSNSSDFVEINSSMSDVVMNALAETVSDSPNLKDVSETDKKVLLWKKWFEQHKELTEGAETPKCDVVTPTAKPMVSKTDDSFVKDILFTDYLAFVLLNKLF